MKASELALDWIKEAFELVAQDETEKRSIVQEIMLRSTDCSRRIIAPVGGRRRHNVLPVSELQHFPLGRLNLVGLWVKDHKVVVRNLWRKVRLEATKQAVDRANWRKF